MSYRLSSVMIFISDMQRAVEFYRDTLGLSVRPGVESPEYVEFTTEGAFLALSRAADDRPPGKSAVGRLTGITLTVSDIEATYRSLSAKGVRFSRPPTKERWGGITTSLFDPDGNETSLLQTMPG